MPLRAQPTALAPDAALAGDLLRQLVEINTPLDAVQARPADLSLGPFTLTERDGFVDGRSTRGDALFGGARF